MLATLSLLLLAAPVAHAVSWPVDTVFTPVLRDAAPVVDGGDVGGALDLSDGALPVLRWFASPDVLWLRIGLARPPVAGPALSADGWGVLLDVDGDDDPELLVAAVGPDPGDVLVAVADGGWTVLPWSPDDDRGVRIEALGGGFVVDVAVPLAVLEDAAALRIALPVRAVAVSWAGAFEDRVDDAWADVAGCDGACATLPWSDDLAIDADADHWPRTWEADQGTDPADGDVDDDGVPDGADPGPTTCDTDRDGLGDGLELGFVTPGSAGTAPGVCFRPDADPASKTDPTLPDTDGGGLSDGDEDRDHDGAVDPVWEADPTLPDDDVDADGDHMADVVEPEACLGKTDCDGDGLPDGPDGFFDPDGDGDVSLLDPDADDDGLRDGAEGTSDPDHDGLGAWLDLDSDGDGLPDAVEGTADWDHDGLADELDLDSDGDKLPDADEGTIDADCDGRPDRLDTVVGDGFCDTDLPRPDVDDSPFGDPLAPISPASPDDLRGCACDTGGASGAALRPLVLLALVALSRRRR